MNSVFRLFGEIAINNSNAKREIKETSTMASKLQGVFSKVGKAALACGKVIATGLAAGTVAMGKLMSDAIGEYADYEQLVGGVETLFKESASKVMGYANNAYKTAGMSANDYMETVTSFSASLLASMRGDTEAAADRANMAITDMADNANKMGTDMTMLQNAYQGFAKGNYTMLDNLKLGYGGTEAEMKRLLSDASKLAGKKFKMGNLADMIEAIHVIQTEMGITGTTAEEAAGTISGSFGATKAAWENLLAGMADPNQDVGELIGNLVDSGMNLLTNVSKILPTLTKNITTAIQALTPQIPVILQTLLPSLIEGAAALIIGLAEALPDLLVAIMDVLPDALAQIFGALGTILPALGDALMKIFQSIDWRGLGAFIANAFKSFIHNLPQILQDIGNVISTIWGDGIWPMIQGLFSAVFGVELPVWDDLWQSISDGWNNTVWPMIQGLFSAMFGVELPDWEGLGQSISDAWNNTVWPAIQGLFSAAFGVELPDWDDLWKNIDDGWNNTVWPNIQGFFKETFGIELPDWSQVWTDIQTWWANVTANFVGYFKALFDFDFTDEEGTVSAQKIRDWFANVLTKCGEFWLSVFGIEMPDVQKIRQQIIDWWNGVKRGLGLVVESQATLHTSSSGRLHGGGVGDRFDEVPGYATGLDYVPYNDMPARLHYGEAVLTREDAAAWRNSTGDVGTLAARLEASISTLSGILQQIASNTGAGANVVLDTGVLVGQLAPRIDAAFGTIANRKGRQ